MTTTTQSATEHYDVIVVGSGFGGSVSALRLVEKGYRVAVLEAGQRFTDATLPATSWRLRKFLWAPGLGLTGLQRIHKLNNVIVLAGAGVGGGSLIYANTLYVPPEPFFKDRQWAHITDWADELGPYYDQASRMLGVTPNPTMTPSDVAIKELAEEMGVGDTFRLTPVGVFFGPRAGETVDDPFFGGVGPARTGCKECGECMTGCRHNAKNTLPKNYLGLAEDAGAVGSEQLFLDATDGKYVATQRDFTGHRDIVAHRNSGQHRGQRDEHGDASARAVFGHGARWDVDVQVGFVEKVLVDAVDLGAAANIRGRGLRRFLHDIAKLAGQRQAALARHA